MLERPIVERQVSLGASLGGLLALPAALLRCFALSEKWTIRSDSLLEGNV